MIARVGLYFSLILAVALAAWGFLAGGFVFQAGGLVLVGAAWALGQRRWDWIGSLGLTVVTLASGAGIYAGLPVTLMAGAALFAFIAWDLADFHLRLKKAAREDEIRGLEIGHFRRLGVVLAGGAAVLLLSRFVRVHFSLEFAALLVLAGAGGISLLVRQLKNGF